MSQEKIPYELAPHQVELVLVALYVFDHLREGSTLTVAELTEKALYNWEIPSLPSGPDPIGQLADHLWEPLYDARLTPADHLRAATRNIDVDTISDEEAEAIVRGIVAQHGPITHDDFERAFAS